MIIINVINLKKHISKRKEFLKNNYKEDRVIYFFDATDGTKLDYDFLIKNNLIVKEMKNAVLFNEKIIGVDEMSEVLSSTEFIPCPNGFFHPETYRIYEALECKCIPIVENTFKYYDRLFPENPFIKVDKWLEAKLIIKNWSQKQI